MRKEITVNQGLNENLIRRSLDLTYQLGAMVKERCECALLSANSDIGGYIKKPYIAFTIILSMTIFSFPVYAECVPAPDCGELGYTATSCEGKFVRCPFDTTKLFCAPCDSIYQYSCSNAGEIGKGNSCNGKYIECGCADGYEVDGSGCKLSCATTYQYTCRGTG